MQTLIMSISFQAATLSQWDEQSGELPAGSQEDQGGSEDWPWHWAQAWCPQLPSSSASYLVTRSQRAGGATPQELSSICRESDLVRLVPS